MPDLNQSFYPTLATVRMKISELTTADQRRAAVPILQQLWSEKTADEILDWTGEDSYHLFGASVDGDIVGVAGVVLATHLHHASQAWLYDLVVDEARRENGYGTELLEFVEQWADEQNCEAVALASPLAKERVHEYYTDRSYERWGYIIEKQL
jgi:GNAT superfamily N-acetyltransferase